MRSLDHPSRSDSQAGGLLTLEIQLLNSANQNACTVRFHKVKSRLPRLRLIARVPAAAPQIVALHDLLHQLRFDPPDGGHLSPAGEWAGHVREQGDCAEG